MTRSLVGDAAGAEVGDGCGHGTGAVGGDEGRGIGDFGEGGSLRRTVGRQSSSCSTASAMTTGSWSVDTATETCPPVECGTTTWAKLPYRTIT